MPKHRVLDTIVVRRTAGYWIQEQYAKLQATSRESQIAACWIQEHYASFSILGTRTVCRMQGTGTRAVCQTVGYWVTRTVCQIAGHRIQEQYSGVKGTLGNKNSMPDRK